MRLSPNSIPLTQWATYILVRRFQEAYCTDYREINPLRVNGMFEEFCQFCQNRTHEQSAERCAGRYSHTTDSRRAFKARWISGLSFELRTDADPLLLQEEETNYINNGNPRCRTTFYLLKRHFPTLDTSATRSLGLHLKRTLDFPASSPKLCRPHSSNGLGNSGRQWILA